MPNPLGALNPMLCLIIRLMEVRAAILFVKEGIRNPNFIGFVLLNDYFHTLYLYSLWNWHKVKLYLETCITQTKIVLPNRVKNENIFGIAPVKPFLRNKSTLPIYFALVLLMERA